MRSKRLYYCTETPYEENGPYIYASNKIFGTYLDNLGKVLQQLTPYGHM